VGPNDATGRVREDKERHGCRRVFSTKQDTKISQGGSVVKTRGHHFKLNTPRKKVGKGKSGIGGHWREGE